MKILHVAETLPGGPASYLEEVLEYQARTFGNANMHLLAAESHLPFVPKNFHGRVTTFERRRRSLGSLINLAIAFHKIMSENIPPDIIHLHSSLAGAVCRMVLAPMRIRAKVVYCAHCWFFDRPHISAVTRFAAYIERRLAKYTDAIINVSPHETDVLLQHGFKLDNVVTIVSGIHDCPRTEAQIAVTDIDELPIRLLFIGRFDEQKGLDLLLKSVRNFNPEKIMVTIVGKAIVGSGDQNGSMLINARYIEWLPRDEIPAMIRDHHFVVMPSRWEGLPLTALEAFREGRPIIANKIPALEALIDTPHHADRPGLIVDLEDPNALQVALHDFSAAKWQSLCKNARAAYLARYKSDEMNSKVVEIYFRLLASNKKISQSHPTSAPLIPGSDEC